MKSFLKCQHTNTQSWTEICPDCGFNIFMTATEYLNVLLQKVAMKKTESVHTQILELERILGIEE